MDIYVLLYNSGKTNEGIHSLEISGETIVLLFENSDDAQRYAGLLEAARKVILENKLPHSTSPLDPQVSNILATKKGTGIKRPAS